MANNTTGFTRIIKAAGYSWKGFRAAWINEAAFRQESVAVLLGVAIACWLDVDAITRVLLIGSVMLVMIVEILNSAIEAVVDAVIAENPDNVAAYKGGKVGLMGWFVGQVMKKSGGKANPGVVNELLKTKLSM